jgi:hypothetical protein
MRFLLMTKADKNSEAGLPPNQKLWDAVEKHTEEMMKAGIILSVGGLVPSSAGTRLVLTPKGITQVDGPFAETKELIAGYAIIEAKSKEEAIQIQRDWFKLHQGLLGSSYEVICEIRQVYGTEDTLPSRKA